MNKRDYVTESDKYLFAVYKDGKIVDNRFYLTLKDAISSQKTKLIYKSDYDKLVIEIYERKNESIPEKENTCFDVINMYRLLDMSDERMRLNGHVNPNLFTTLPYNKIIELNDIIYNFLQKNLIIDGCYQIGKRVEILNLNANEYLKYI